MAVTDYDALTSVTRKRVLPKVYDQITDEKVVLSYLWKGIASKVSGGLSTDVPVRYKRPTQGKWYSGLETLNSSQENTRTRANFQWKQLSEPIIQSNIDIAKNGGKEAVVDLYKSDFSEAKETFGHNLATAFYEAGSSYNVKAIEGLKAAIDDSSTNTSYGAINRSSYSWWQSYVNSTGGAISLSMLATALRNLKKDPTVILTTRTVWDSYEALLAPKARYNYDKNGVPKGDAGFPAIYFRGVPIVSDDYCPSGYVFLVNTPTFKFDYLSHPEFGSQSGGMAISNLERPYNQDGRIGYILLYGKFYCVEPRRNGVISSVT